MCMACAWHAYTQELARADEQRRRAAAQRRAAAARVARSGLGRAGDLAARGAGVCAEHWRLTLGAAAVLVLRALAV